jgi:DNA polymerase III subunit delta
MVSLILIHGKNSVLSKEKLDGILKERKQFFGEDFIIFDFSQQKYEFHYIKSEISNESMFFKKRVVVLKSFFEEKDLKEEFLKQEEWFSKKEGLIILFESDSIPKTDILYKFLKKNGHIYEFEELDVSKIKDFIKAKLLENNFKIEPTALTQLINAVNNDFWRLKYELDKLIVFKIREKIITKDDVEKLVRLEVDSDIFKTIDAIAKKDKKKAIQLVHLHLERGDSAPYIFSMIAFQFRNMLIIKDKMDKNTNISQFQLKKELKGINPFVLQKSLWLIKDFNSSQLEKIYKKIFQMDLSVKNGKMQPEEALEILLLDI